MSFGLQTVRARWGWGATCLALLALSDLCVACAEGSSSVTRMANGVRYQGRFINPEAYAAYASGVEREARGEYGKAVSWYLEARADDTQSPEIWARIGAAQCFGAEPAQGPGVAAHAFETGIRLDDGYYGNYFERGRCRERARAFEAALTDAIAAVSRRPGDEPSNLLVARLLQAQGRAAEARAWLEAFQGYSEISPAMRRALDAARASNATAAGTPLSASAEATATRPANARSAAFAELGSGQLEAALEHAQQELGADPSNSDAWIAKLVACDALRDEQCFQSTLESLRTPSLAPSDTGLAFLNQLLARRVGVQIAR